MMDFTNTKRSLLYALPAIGIVLCCGCGSSADVLPGRVAIEVTVQIAGVSVKDGTLVLRPEPGVKCPLIKIPVFSGIGRLAESAGPVPGDYSATFRPSGVGADITEQLTKSGRTDPTAGGGVGRPSMEPKSPGDTPMPKAPIPMTVPADNPAKVVAAFEAI